MLLYNPLSKTGEGGSINPTQQVTAECKIISQQ